MNCQDIAGILDDGDSRGLSAAERRALDAHLASCAECGAALRAHEAMSAITVPAMGADLAVLCREAAIAKAAGPARRAGGRPFYVVGLLLVGAAAAAFVGLQVVNESGVNSNVAAGIDEAESPEGIDQTDPGPTTDAVANATPAPTAVPTVADVEGIAPGGAFTVAVRPRNIQTIPDAASVYFQFLEGLRKVPNLELVELDAAPPSPAGSAAVTAGASFTGVDQLSPDAGPRTLVLVDSRNLATSSGAQVDMSQIPTALVGRIETVTGGAATTYEADAAAGVVNLILDNNVEGVRVDTSYAAVSPTGAVEPMAYDFMLDVTASAAPSSDLLQFSVRARSRDGSSYSNSAALRLTEPARVTEVIAQLIVSLQDGLFPVDSASLEAIERRVLDARLPLDERIEEIGRLRQLAQRLGITRLPDEVALAIVDMASRADTQRLVLLSTLRDFDNPVLIQPWSNILRSDANVGIRVLAVSMLEQYRHDSLARAALESAANSDPNAEVRRNARLASLDADGRRAYAVATILDTRLGDTERLDALVIRGLGAAIDVTVANELATLLRRHESADSRAQALSRLQRESSPALTPLFIERLNEDPAEVVRRAAASALSGRLDEPGARPALERAAAGDPSPGVRDMASRVLAGQDPESVFVIRN